ncbi:MAG TPA: RnfABCDGE type electron transport complex subunit B [Candidatus Latescibacteria bacterium]|nr:RnfABCDGE type electron transport complex subunit B [Candidatus Latescibacterota bacterium]
MSGISLSAMLWLGGLGLLFGAVLAWASLKFTVKEDPRVEQVLEMLPGANCGACGYPSCRGFAEKLVAGDAPVNSCVVGGAETLSRISEFLGVDVEERIPMIAVLHCKGGDKECKRLYDYNGIADCRAATLLAEGPKACRYGCIGLGTCVTSCPFGAIKMGDNGLPVIDEVLCTGCGRCVNICPKRIIGLIPKAQKIYLGCSSHDRGAKVKKICEVGCTGCSLCVKVTTTGGISMEDFLPVIDYNQSPNLVAAAHKCPQNCFVDRAKVRSKVSIGTECDGCGACKPVCPTDAIEGEPGERHKVMLEKCIGCGLCVPTCAKKAIFIMGALGYVEA